ncbi:DUF2827 family protein [Burkholderia latens]|uniref:DUF2827 family protein n=1 Tax=Burkholderia latens TaxID=488446 RepID=A0A6H9T1T7_9BURK|nr:DUF2827 family protein [Burkholderia latens]KAB0644812.1 DUF2827 family protein [Burkholderia latens]VWB16995.1 hypothetical protein BLA24064_00627 [Burkholderia latens]
MRIGISVLTHSGHSVWENGLGQNVCYFAQLLRGLPFVTDIVLLNCGDQNALAPEVEAAALGLRLIAPREATDLVDVVFEMGGGLDVEWLDHMRALGKKVVFFCCGQPYVGLIEPTIFKKDGYFARATRCDEIWILEKDREFAPMLRALHRCPVVEVPFLWDPVFVEQRVRAVEAAGLTFGYQPMPDLVSPRRLRVSIFEPNISVVKCCTIPLLICEAAHRIDAEAIDRVHVLNSVQMKDHPTFSFMTSSLELGKKNKLHLDHRHDFVGYASQYVDAVVAHQWNNTQNIVYLDALYGGYPLIHNSPWLGTVGYFYTESRVNEGAGQLLNAAYMHDVAFRDYQAETRAFLARLSPANAKNRSDYARTLLAIGGANLPRSNGRRAACRAVA